MEVHFLLLDDYGWYKKARRFFRSSFRRTRGGKGKKAVLAMGWPSASGLLTRVHHLKSFELKAQISFSPLLLLCAKASMILSRSFALTQNTKQPNLACQRP